MEASQATPPKTTERPEIPIAAALVGGIILAQILKRLGPDD
jgi:hypothetical protein